MLNKHIFAHHYQFYSQFISFFIPFIRMETKSVDPDYMVSSEAIRSGSTVISKVVMPRINSLRVLKG